MLPFLLILMIITLVFVFPMGLRLWQFSQLMRKPNHTPQDVLRQGRKSSTHRLIMCIGDSITQGAVSANYVAMLEEKFMGKGYEFINAGINGNLAWNVVQRLEDIIACQPDIVTILIGTNDVNATVADQLEDLYRRQQNIPEKPTLAWYRQNVEKIIDRLQAETHARIGLLELPMLGEDLSSDINRKIAIYNDTLHEISEQKNIHLISINKELQALLSLHNMPPVYDGSLKLAGIAVMKRVVLGRTWDAIALSHGLSVLVDHIHLNEKGAAVIADRITDFLRAASSNTSTMNDD